MRKSKQEGLANYCVVHSVNIEIQFYTFRKLFSVHKETVLGLMAVAVGVVIGPSVCLACISSSHFLLKHEINQSG